MDTVIEQDYEMLLRDMLLQSVDPAWTNVVMKWIRRFDGWYLKERESERNPQAAIAYDCLRREPIRRGVARTANLLAHLPFNRWTATTLLTIQRQWSPVDEDFRSFLTRNKDNGVYAFPLPEVPPQRRQDTLAYLRAMYELEVIKQKVLDQDLLGDD
ncbi:hypothetical protein WM40_26590 [Robbsia andropogonis]|uniref:Uncharacterized protein n=1 Tax=Robbsia andropogonis TaxID=28092 RepID=A0A0F5JTB2_9BURK|nr:hypothetical protein [Robbsia andropogonis]KKB60880.1 hypothetical protein WM40_26590 [Robbsia andropogonis]